MAESKISKKKRICQVEGCENIHYGRGFCSKHYTKFRAKGCFGLGTCEAGGCDAPIHGRGLCNRHYIQLKRKGYVYRSCKDKNYYEQCDNIYKIHLQNREGDVVGKAIIDIDDYWKAIKHRWHMDSNGYAKNNGSAGLHKIVIGDVPESMEIDHIDRNPLNNMKSNLRVVSRSQNLANSGMSKNNTTGFKGVYMNHGKIVSQIYFDGKLRYLGTFKGKIEAAKAYDIAAIERSGDFALTNKGLGLLS